MARVLIIEDNPDNLALMRYLLQAFGHDTITAADGEEGLACAQIAEGLDIIVCDVHLPNMDGYAVAQRLKVDPRLQRIPLVAVTALAMVGDKDKVLAAGFDGYITKPIAPREFVGQVQGFLPGGGEANRAEMPAVLSGVARPQVSEATRHSGRILVVDDSSTNRDLAQATLAPFGYQVIPAGRVGEALELLALGPFDLILSDLRMPDGDGFAFLSAVKADAGLRNLPFMLISSSVWGTRDQERGLALGAARFLLRPIAPRRLLEEVRACLAEA